MAAPEMTDVHIQDREYEFPNPHGEETIKIRVKGVNKFGVGKSGTHRLETEDGKKHIIPTGWVALHLDLEEWTL